MPLPFNWIVAFVLAACRHVAHFECPTTQKQMGESYWIGVSTGSLHQIHCLVLDVPRYFRQVKTACQETESNTDNNMQWKSVPHFHTLQAVFPFSGKVNPLHTGKFELETRFVFKFVGNSNVLCRNFHTKLIYVKDRNPTYSKIHRLTGNVPIVRVGILNRIRHNRRVCS